jgi:hypothetical protein
MDVNVVGTDGWVTTRPGGQRFVAWIFHDPGRFSGFGIHAQRVPSPTAFISCRLREHLAADDSTVAPKQKAHQGHREADYPVPPSNSGLHDAKL